MVEYRGGERRRKSEEKPQHRGALDDAGADRRSKAARERMDECARKAVTGLQTFFGRSEQGAQGRGGTLPFPFGSLAKPPNQHRRPRGTQPCQDLVGAGSERLRVERGLVAQRVP